MVKLGQTTTGKGRGVEYMWLVKDMGIYKRYSKKECYVVLGFTKTSGGWFSMFNGTLKACRDFIGAESVVDLEAETKEEPEEVKPEEPEKVAAVVEKTVHGYTVEQYIIGAFDTPIALIDRHLNFCSWVVAWNYDKDSDTWGQGHYFDDKAAAVAYFKTYMQ